MIYALALLFVLLFGAAVSTVVEHAEAGERAASIARHPAGKGRAL